jgi:hypothetical protein
MAYELKENPIHGKVLAYKGRISVLPESQAKPLAEKYSGTLIKSPTGNYMIRLPEHAQTLAECECQGGMQMGMLMPQTYNQGDISFPDHEVQMARQELYRTAKLAMMTHELLKGVGERQGLEGWVQSKLTRAADYIETVFAYLDYEMRYPTAMMPESKDIKKKKRSISEKIQPIQPIQPIRGTRTGMQDEDPTKRNPPPRPAERVPGLVMMVPTNDEGEAAGPPIQVPAAEVGLKQQNGFKVVGESASAGASSAGGMAAGGFGNGFLNGGPGSVQRRKKKRTTENSTDTSDGSPHDRGSADSYYGRKSDPHKYVTTANGDRHRVKLTDPAEIKAYQTGYGSETGRKDYGESTNTDRMDEMPSPRSMGRAGRSWADQKKSYDRQRHGYLKTYKDTDSTSKSDMQAEIDRLKQEFLDKGGRVSRAPTKTKRVKETEETGPKFTGYWKGTDKGPPGKKMVGGGA